MVAHLSPSPLPLLFPWGDASARRAPGDTSAWGPWRAEPTLMVPIRPSALGLLVPRDAARVPLVAAAFWDSNPVRPRRHAAF